MLLDVLERLQDPLLVTELFGSLWGIGVCCPRDKLSTLCLCPLALALCLHLCTSCSQIKKGSLEGTTALQTHIGSYHYNQAYVPSKLKTDMCGQILFFWNKFCFSLGSPNFYLRWLFYSKVRRTQSSKHPFQKDQAYICRDHWAG